MVHINTVNFAVGGIASEDFVNTKFMISKIVCYLTPCKVKCVKLYFDFSILLGFNNVPGTQICNLL